MNTFADTLKTDERGAIIYTYRGLIERGAGGRYVWREGYSPTTKDGGIIYPWMTKQDCRRDAKTLGCKATFRGAAQ